MSDQVDERADVEDPLYELIVGLHDRVGKLEQDRRVMMDLVRTLAREMGYELSTREQGGGKIRAEWVKSEAPSRILRV